MSEQIRKVWKTKTWEDNWNDTIKYTLFKNADLKNEMLIPTEKQSSLKDFISKYFIEDMATDALVIDEDVRIIWSIESNPFVKNSRFIHQKYLVFDIYVKRNQLYTVDAEDRLRARDVAIAKRLRYLLTHKKSVNGITFDFADEFRPMSKAVGYQRLRVVFTYFVTY